MIAIELDGGFEAASKMVTKTNIFTHAVSLGSTDSLIEHPAGLTHRIVSEEGRTMGGITEGMIRLAIGIEDVNDLFKDLAQALKN